jgi:type II secretory pathway component PulF
MTYFLYRAKKGPDEVVEGRIEADSETAAAKQLIQAGFYPIWIKTKAIGAEERIESIPFISRKIKTKDLANFTRQLSELLDSGLALYDSLNIIGSQIDHPQLKEVISGIGDKIKDGNTFSESLKAHPNIFSNLYINLVKSGEVGGMLNEVLANIADFLEKQEDTRSKITASLVYPMLMLVVGVITIFILMTFVIPKLANMFVEMGERLPFPTRILMGIGSFLRRYWILLVVFICGAIISFKKIKSNTVARKNIDTFKLNLPIFGRILKNTELARFSRTLSTLVKNGVPILNALRITSDIIENSVIKEEVIRIYDDVKAGSSLTAAIKKNPSFPQFVVNMSAIGEEGGTLDKTLLKVAKSYELEIDRLVKIISSLIEPVVILIMGVIVGFIVISMLLPVFQISLTAH